MSKGSSTSPLENEPAGQIRKLAEELNNMTDQRDEISHRCHELDLQVHYIWIDCLINSISDSQFSVIISTLESLLPSFMLLFVPFPSYYSSDVIDLFLYILTGGWPSGGEGQLDS